MRILVTTQPEQSHLWPMVPYLQALEAAGHQVRVGSGAHFLTHVERAGLSGVACGLDWGIAHAPEEQLRAMAIEDGVQQRNAFVGFFAGRAARQMAVDVLEFAERWRPDVVLSDWLEFGADVAAEVLDVPYLPISVGMRCPPAMLREIAGPQLQRLRADHGLPSDPDCQAHYRHGCVSLFPAEWLPSDRGPLDGEVFLTPVPDRTAEPDADAWLAALPDPPVVYATLGSIFGVLRGPLDTVIEGLAAGGWPAVVATGPLRDPDTLGPLPDHVRVEPWVPQRALLGAVDLVVHHAGYSTCMDAVLAGTPQAVLPLSADQPEHAQAVRRLGLGRVVPAVRELPFGPVVERRHLSAEAVGTAIEEALAERRHRQRSIALGDRMRGLPATARFVNVVEDLAL